MCELSYKPRFPNPPFLGPLFIWAKVRDHVILKAFKIHPKCYTMGNRNPVLHGTGARTGSLASEIGPC